MAMADDQEKGRQRELLCSRYQSRGGAVRLEALLGRWGPDLGSFLHSAAWSFKKNYDKIHITKFAILTTFECTV